MNVEANKNITDTEDCTNAHTVTVEHLVIRHGSLFSGIGGFDLAAQWTGWKNVFQVEIDDYCTKVLEKNFPNAKRYRDIREFDGTQYKGTIDGVSGGFPCQPFSVAGKRKGKEDDRYLWPEMLRVISEIKPTWIVGENVAGIINMALDQVLFEVEGKGYTTETFIIPACAVNAPHRRDRVWIIGKRILENAGGGGLCGQDVCSKQSRRTQAIGTNEDDSNGDNKGLQRRDNGTSRGADTEQFSGHLNREWEQSWFEVATRFCRVADGVPHRMDRLKGLGNAIVPQVAFEIFKRILEVEKQFERGV